MFRFVANPKLFMMILQTALRNPNYECLTMGIGYLIVNNYP